MGPQQSPERDFRPQLRPAPLAITQRTLQSVNHTLSLPAPCARGLHALNPPCVAMYTITSHTIPLHSIDHITTTPCIAITHHTLCTDACSHRQCCPAHSSSPCSCFGLSAAQPSVHCAATRHRPPSTPPPPSQRPPPPYPAASSTRPHPSPGIPHSQTRRAEHISPS